MSKAKNQMIRQINSGHNLEKVVPEYLENFMNITQRYSLFQLCFEYYDLIEKKNENEEVYLEGKDLINQLDELVGTCFCKAISNEEIQKAIDTLERCRKETMDRMDYLTMYIDQLLIYEYVLNRNELKFKDDWNTIEENYFIEKVNSYIFEMKDAKVMNERIHEIIEQLPIRMTKSKYLEYVKDSIRLYIGTEQSALDTYLYMLRTCSMLYSPKETLQYGQDIKEAIEKLKKAEYKNLTKEQYDELSALVNKNAKLLREKTDFYMIIQAVINHFYAYLLSFQVEGEKEESEIALASSIMKNLYEKRNSKVDESIDNLMIQTEGKIEKIDEDYMKNEAVFYQIYNKRNEETFSDEIKERIEDMNHIIKLCDIVNLFTNLEEEEKEELVTEEYADQVAEQLMSDLANLFKELPQVIVRAIMANTLSKMPLFFQNREEVENYITMSLQQCSNVEEKTVAMSLILDLIYEESKWNEM